MWAARMCASLFLHLFPKRRCLCVRVMQHTLQIYLSVHICVNVCRCACRHLFVVCGLLSRDLSSRLYTVYPHTAHCSVAAGCCSHIRQYGNGSLTPIMQKRWELVAKPDISLGCCVSSGLSVAYGPVCVCVYVCVRKGMRIYEAQQILWFSVDG